MGHVKSPSRYSNAKVLGDIIDRVWKSSGEEPPQEDYQETIRILKDALWKACGDDKEMVDSYIESVK